MLLLQQHLPRDCNLRRHYYVYMGIRVAAHIELILTILFINCSLVGIVVKMIPRDSADSAVFSCIKTISNGKSIEIISSRVLKLEKLHFFQGTIFKLT